MKEYKNILMINYGGIGDEILFLPAISSVKNRYKNAKITLALEPRAKVIKDLSNDIDEIICVDIKAQGIKKYLNILKLIFTCYFKKFDCVISSGKSPLVPLILFLTGIKKRIGYNNSKTGFLLTTKVDLNEDQYAAKMYHCLVEDFSNLEFQNPRVFIDKSIKLPIEFQNKSYIALHAGVSKMSILKNIYKCPSSSFWNDLILGLLQKDKTVVLLGSEDDKEIVQQILQNNTISHSPNFINYFNKTKNIQEMALIMKNAQSVICVDSAPLHVALGVGSKVFAIFGPTNENKLVGDSSNVEIITSDVNCRPCLWDKRSFNCEKSECLNIDVNLILDKIN